MKVRRVLWIQAKPIMQSMDLVPAYLLNGLHRILPNKLRRVLKCLYESGYSPGGHAVTQNLSTNLSNVFVLMCPKGVDEEGKCAAVCPDECVVGSDSAVGVDYACFCWVRRRDQRGVRFAWPFWGDSAGCGARTRARGGGNRETARGKQSGRKRPGRGGRQDTQGRRYRGARRG